jgi:hypothetical protein
MTFLRPFRPAQVSADSTNDPSEEQEVVEPGGYDAEYIHMSLMNGESVRFNRLWSGYRFTDKEVEMLMAGYEIRIKTDFTDGINGSLDWQEFNGHEFFGFAPWDAGSYEREDAPFPVKWNDHVFTEEEQKILRRGERLLLLCESKNSRTPYAVNVSFGFIPKEGAHPARWGIIPHFEQFDQPAELYSRETCVFLPKFSGETLSRSEIEMVRSGKSIPFSGLSRNGRPYRCRLTLELDEVNGRWRITPHF